MYSSLFKINTCGVNRADYNKNYFYHNDLNKIQFFSWLHSVIF